MFIQFISIELQADADLSIMILMELSGERD